MSAPGGRAAGAAAGLGNPGRRRRPGAEPPAAPEDEAPRLCPPPHPGRCSRRDARREPGGEQLRLRGRGASTAAPHARRPLGLEKPRRPPARLGRTAAAHLGGPPLAEPAALPPSASRGLGDQRAAAACAAEPELRGQREPGTSAAEAETRREGGPSATPWPRLERSLRAGGPAPGPGASPARNTAACAAATALCHRAPPEGSSAGRAPAGDGCPRRPSAPLTSLDLPFCLRGLSREPPAPFRDLGRGGQE